MVSQFPLVLFGAFVHMEVKGKETAGDVVFGRSI